MGRDPWGGQPNIPSTLHGYNYTDNNPVNYVDPTGLRRIAAECGGTDLFSSYSVGNRSLASYYILVNYQQEPWGCYKSEIAPYHTILIPVRHRLNLDPSEELCLEEAVVLYASGTFTAWEVNARNIIVEMKGTILNQKEWALRDAIGIANVPYNRIDFNNNQPDDERYPYPGYKFGSYENRNDALGVLLSGEFAISSGEKSAYTSGLNPGQNYADVYDFALIVAYGVHYKYLRDTSYGATGYRHFEWDEEQGEGCPSGYEYALFKNQRAAWYGTRSWQPTSEELEASGGWDKWTESDRARRVEWETPYPPEGCVYNDL